MSQEARSCPGRRARPVAEAAVDILLERAEELARGWAIALILARPLQRIGEIPLGDIAREAPALCAQAIRALESDVELERMAGPRARSGREEFPGAHRLGALAGAGDAGAAVEAVEALRSVLWEALIDELRAPTARQVADLADRLGYVCATVLDATLAAPFLPDAEMASEAAGVPVGGPSPANAHQSGASPERDRASGRGSRAVLVDERADGPGPVARIAQTQPMTARPLPWDLPLTASSQMPEIEAEEGRAEQGSAAWIGSIGTQLERFERDGLRFAVLLVELDEIERLHGGVPSGGLSCPADELEGALEAELRGGADRSAGSLTRERPGRYWLLAPHTDAGAADALAERLARVARGLRSRDGAPLEVAVGTAVCPEDGRDAAALAAHADVGLLAARASGRSAARRSVTLVDEPV